MLTLSRKKTRTPTYSKIVGVNLLQKQQLFARRLPTLLNWLHENGYEVTFGETWRPPEEASRLARTGQGVSNSLHCTRLAVDLNLWKDGVWLTRTEDFRAPGQYWESLSDADAKCCWGGRFGDGNHFSIEHGGVR